MGQNANCGYVRITCSLVMNQFKNFLEQLNNGTVWLSLFHLAQRGTREEQPVFRKSSHSTSHWV